MEALEPFQTKAETQNPVPLSYLKESPQYLYDIKLQIGITPKGSSQVIVSNSNARYLYWSFKQQLIHHSSSGCPMKPGDLCGSGTISGPDVDSYGSMLEISWKGTRSVRMSNGTERKFIQDGDTVSMRGFCEGNGFRIGFGSCDGTILPANL